MERLVASVPPAMPSSKAASVSAATTSLYGSLGGSGRSLTSTSGSPPSVAALVAASAMAGGSAGDDDSLPRAGPAGEAAGDDEVGGGAGKDEEEPASGFPVPTWPSEEDLSLPLSDLLMASAAAPTFFPTHKGSSSSLLRAPLHRHRLSNHSRTFFLCGRNQALSTAAFLRTTPA